MAQRRWWWDSGDETSNEAIYIRWGACSGHELLGCSSVCKLAGRTVYHTGKKSAASAPTPVKRSLHALTLQTVAD